MRERRHIRIGSWQQERFWYEPHVMASVVRSPGTGVPTGRRLELSGLTECAGHHTNVDLNDPERSFPRHPLPWPEPCGDKASKQKKAAAVRVTFHSRAPPAGRPQCIATDG